VEEQENQKRHEFFVDAQRFESESSSVTGAEIKAKASVPATYQLFEEVEGDHPDRAIADSESVNLAGKVRHFFAVPPATFG
jgi:hypothetical protein